MGGSVTIETKGYQIVLTILSGVATKILYGELQGLSSNRRVGSASRLAAVHACEVPGNFPLLA